MSMIWWKLAALCSPVLFVLGSIVLLKLTLVKRKLKKTSWELDRCRVKLAHVQSELQGEISVRAAQKERYEKRIEELSNELLVKGKAFATVMERCERGCFDAVLGERFDGLL